MVTISVRTMVKNKANIKSDRKDRLLEEEDTLFTILSLKNFVISVSL